MTVFRRRKQRNQSWNHQREFVHQHHRLLIVNWDNIISCAHNMLLFYYTCIYFAIAYHCYHSVNYLRWHIRSIWMLVRSLQLICCLLFRWTIAPCIIHNYLQAKLSYFQCIQSVPKVIDDDEQTNGRITLGLFGNTAPKAVENFRSLCNCDKGNGKISGKPLCYKESIFHRISEFCVGMQCLLLIFLFHHTYLMIIFFFHFD